MTLKARTADPQRHARRRWRGCRSRSRALLALPGTRAGASGRVTVGGAATAFTLRVTPELRARPTRSRGDGVVLSDRAGRARAAARARWPPRLRSARPSARCPDEVDSLVFLDLRQLLALGEQTGLTAIPGLGTARDDLPACSAAGAVVARIPPEKTDTTAELFLEIP